MIRSRVEYLLITLSDISYSSDIYISEKGIIRRFIDMKGKISLYYNRITIRLQSVASSPTSWKHTVQAVPQHTKKNDKGERQKKNEKEERKTRWR